MKTEKPTPTATLTRLASIAPDTSAFRGWGPRMSSSVANVLRGLN